MLRWIATLSVLAASFTVHAGSTLTSLRFSSCANENCVEIKSAKAFQSFLGSSSLFFSKPTIRLVDSHGKEQIFQAESIFFDSVQNRLFIRDMADGSKRKPVEAYYQLNEGKLFVIAGADRRN
jgi:hypothetical protein